MPRRSRSCAASTRSSSTCSATARSRSSGRPTARASSPRSTPPTVASTPRSTRQWRAPAGSAPTRRTCTTSPSAPTRAAPSGRRSCRPPATSCSSPTTTRSSCACIAHLADDPGLVAAFERGDDIHTATAARVFGVAPDAVTHEQRSKAKMVCYGLAYGMEAYGLAQRLSIEVPEATEILDAYFVAFPVGARLHGAHRRARPASAATPRRCSAAAGTSPSWRRRTSASARPASGRP